MGIERVEKKVDKIILAPLQNALFHYGKGLNEIKFEKYENALESFKIVTSEAIDGLNKMKDGSGSVSIDEFLFSVRVG